MRPQRVRICGPILPDATDAEHGLHRGMRRYRTETDTCGRD